MRMTFKQFTEGYVEKRKYTKEEAKKIGDKFNLDWGKYDLEQFRMGLEVELEHDTKSAKTDVVNDIHDAVKIVLAHLNEIPNYYTKLKKMEGD